MAIRPIIELGNPLLRQPSRPVKQEELTDLNQLVLDLWDTLQDFRTQHGFGRGIAAPQVGANKRLVIISRQGQPLVMINPKLVKQSDDEFTVWDACFSYPGIWFQVDRKRQVTVEFRDLNWQVQTLEAQDDLAELIQHEIEHLDGKLAIDLVKDLTSFCTTREYFARYREPAQ